MVMFNSYFDITRGQPKPIASPIVLGESVIVSRGAAVAHATWSTSTGTISHGIARCAGEMGDAEVLCGDHRNKIAI